jgi:hypothetical protein
VIVLVAVAATIAAPGVGVDVAVDVAVAGTGVGGRGENDVDDVLRRRLTDSDDIFEVELWPHVLAVASGSATGATAKRMACPS